MYFLELSKTVIEYGKVFISLRSFVMTVWQECENFKHLIKLTAALRHSTSFEGLKFKKTFDNKCFKRNCKPKL